MSMRYVKNIYRLMLAGCLAMITITGLSQPVPAADENIPYLMTFGGDGET